MLHMCQHKICSKKLRPELVQLGVSTKYFPQQLPHSCHVVWLFSTSSLNPDTVLLYSQSTGAKVAKICNLWPFEAVSIENDCRRCSDWEQPAFWQDCCPQVSHLKLLAYKLSTWNFFCSHKKRQSIKSKLWPQTRTSAVPCHGWISWKFLFFT